jgi:type I restriction enzyme M protein
MRPDTGRMAVVLPHGALFRKGAEGKIRQMLIEADLLEAVIGMGPNIFYGTTLAACILVFRAEKQADRAGKVLFIDGSDQIRVGRAQNFLEPQHVEIIYGWYNAFADEPNRAKVVELDELRAKEFNLNIPLYIEKEAADELPTLEHALHQLDEAAQAAWQAEDRFKALLKTFDLL